MKCVAILYYTVFVIGVNYGMNTREIIVITIVNIQ